MRTLLSVRAVVASAIGLLAVVVPARAEEGMWLFSDPPAEMIRETYGVSLGPEWFTHIQKSAVRFSDGGSGSFVSADGLALTNHHVASTQIAKLSTPERNITRDGFLVASREQELPCPDLELLSLQEIEDVTARVKAAIAGASTPAEQDAARKRVIAEIEAESKEKTGLHSEVVTLYGGGVYHVYRYHRYTDVRLVFAPEEDIAFLGGDVDNFEFPRFNLDMTLVRVYENGVPVHPEHFLRFTTEGVVDGQPVFVAGHPGSTQRGYTVDHLRSMRDVTYPRVLDWVCRREVELNVFSGLGEEEARIARDDVLTLQNRRKARLGMLEALLDPRIMEAKEERERHLRSTVDANPQWKAQWGSAWDEIARAEAVAAEIGDRDMALNGRSFMGGSELAAIARGIVRITEEKAKPSGERLEECRDATLAFEEMMIFSPAPIYDSLERNRIKSGLMSAAEALGGDDPVVRIIMGGVSPTDRARDLVASTTLRDVEVRRRLVEGGVAAVRASTDPLIQLMLAIDPASREVRSRFDEEVDGVERNAYDMITAARFAAFGSGMYPDATFTLRLATGRVAGYDQEGVALAPFTTFEGMYTRCDAAGNADPFDMPARWAKARASLKIDTPFNFVTTNDIIGGNSGSPVVNADGALVGLIFDGNRYSYVWDVAFEGERGRAVAVDARGMIEALGSVYGATAIVDELMGKK